MDRINAAAGTVGTPKIWAIADLHLSFAREEDRGRFAGRWRDHAEKIEREWRQVVGRKDLVLIPGDISMARNHREIQPDFAWLERLPGTKVLSRGNHDGWWNNVGKIRPLLRRSMVAVEGDALEIADVIVCGASGFSPDREEADAKAMSTEARELRMLDLALANGVQLRGERQLPILLLWHYPPFDRFGQPSLAVQKIEDAGVSACLYGHVHAEGQWATAVQGEVRGVRYHCVAADAIGFRPLRIPA